MIEITHWYGSAVYVRMPEGYEGMMIQDIDEAFCMMQQVYAIEKGWA